MNIDEMALGELKKIAAMFSQGAEPDSEDGDGRAVIVRSQAAGVLYGNFAGRAGSTISLTNARQMWRWKAAKGGTLLDCAVFGVDGGGCKFSEAQATAQVFNACALIDCSPDASRSIEAVKGGDWS